MGNERFESRSVTLNSLRDEQQALSRRMLLALQLRDLEAQEALRRELEEGAAAARPHMKNQPACQYCPYRPVCGREFSDRDVENGTVSVRHRSGEDLGAMSLEDFAALLKAEVDSMEIN